MATARAEQNANVQKLHYSQLPPKPETDQQLSKLLLKHEKMIIPGSHNAASYRCCLAAPSLLAQCRQSIAL